MIAAGGLLVDGANSVAGASQVRAELTAAGIPGRLAAKDPTLWGAEAEEAGSLETPG